jgi:hypothetical protein
MRCGRETQVNQSQFWRLVELTQNALDLGAGRRSANAIVLAKHKAQRVYDQGIVINNQ